MISNQRPFKTLIEINMALIWSLVNQRKKNEFGDIFVMILNEKNPSLSEEVENKVS